MSSGVGVLGEGRWWERGWLTATVIAYIVILLFARPASREASEHLGTRQAMRVLFLKFPLKSGGRDFSLL